MKIAIASAAQQEFNEAKEFYEIEQAGLGARFEREIKFILAFAHLHRKPDYWIDRI